MPTPQVARARDPAARTGGLSPQALPVSEPGVANTTVPRPAPSAAPPGARQTPPLTDAGRPVATILASPADAPAALRVSAAPGQPPVASAAAPRAAPITGLTSAEAVVLRPKTGTLTTPVPPTPPTPEVPGPAPVLSPQTRPALEAPVPVLRRGNRLAPKPLTAPLSPTGTNGLRDVRHTPMGDLPLLAPIPTGSAATPFRALAAPPPAASSAPPAAQQITTAALTLAPGDGPIEITLDPPELGRVRLSLSEAAGGLMLTITAERSETVDLMRRHLDHLAQEFIRAGLTPPQTQLGNGARGEDAAPDGEEPPHDGDTTSAAPETSPRSAAPRSGTGALDLRL